MEELLQGAPERTKCDMRKGGGRDFLEIPGVSKAEKTLQTNGRCRAREKATEFHTEKTNTTDKEQLLLQKGKIWKYPYLFKIKFKNIKDKIW